MNSDTPSSGEWRAFASRLFDGDLSEAEMADFAELLAADPSAHSEFVAWCELNAMLESEPSIQTAMTADRLPRNVVPLAGGGRGVSGLGDKAETGLARPPRTRFLVALSAAAVLVVGATAVLWIDEAGKEAKAPLENAAPIARSGAEPGKPGNGGANGEAGEGTGREQSVHAWEGGGGALSEDEEPQAQYERAVLASLGSGSQQRPPTNFKSEPSLAGEAISFNRHIRPILSDNCFSCHGPDEASRKAGLRLDTFEGATGGDSPAVLAGDPDGSELIARVRASDAEDIMPPPESHKKLTPAQMDLLAQWIAAGAEWEEHWSFLPIATRDLEANGAEAIDVLVDLELDKFGLSRAPEADPRTLIRRVTLDLTGLPPTPAEVERFLADSGSAAYEALVDELMARPAFGEHRARYWLDAARYGDTHGLHLDNYREMWPYRDWIIRAFNRNQPFDQFTVEQIAGDLLPDATPEQVVATGFNRCNVTTSEGGSIEEEFLVRYAVDRVATTSTVWMGLTAGCAQCHDHKFDPITMRDFYSLYAFFNNTTQKGMDGNAKDTPPVVRVYDSPEQEAEAAGLRKEIATWEKKAREILDASGVEGLTLDAVKPDFVNHGDSPEPTVLEGAGQFGKSDPFTVSFRFRLPEEDGRTLLVSRMEPSGAEAGARGWRVFWDERGIVVELIESHPDKMIKRGATRRFRAGATGHFAFTYDGSGQSEGIQLYSNGEALNSRFTNQWFDTLEGDFLAEGVPLRLGGKDPGSGLVPEVTDFLVKDRRLSATEMKHLFSRAAVASIEKKEDEKRDNKERAQLKEYLLALSDGPYRDALRKISDLETALSRIESTTATTLVMAEKEEAPMAHILERGEYELKGEKVPPAFPAFLPAIEGEFPLNRLGLARWLVHPDHPLTARVTVNRIWQELFGVGLVKTAEDFGTQGENPSHPELLDWLAAEFIASGWDVKALYRKIVLSDTYRQSSKFTEDMAKRDPENRLLARGPRFRMDAEMIRDQALHVSGLLDETFGGPGVRPYQPAGIWEAVGYTNSNTQTFFQDYGPAAEHRRSIYTFWKRTAHPPYLAIFDAPNRETCEMRRERTNTPLQALVLMNDPQFVRASRHLAMRVLSGAEEQDDRLDNMAELVRGRPLDGDERQVVVNSLDQFRNMYESNGEAASALLVDEVNDTFSLRSGESANGHPASEVAAWTMVANQLLNLDESLNKN